MSGSVFKYSAAGTKIRAMYSKLLTEKDYMHLISRKSVREVVEYLKKHTSYDKILSDINENDVHRNELEIVFKESLFNDYNKIFHFINGNSRKFIEAVFLKNEMEDIKVLIGEIYTGRDNKFVLNSLVFLKKYSKLDYNKLIASRDLDQLIDNLKGTEYYRTLSFFKGRKEKSLFEMEMYMDISYLMSILKLKDTLTTGEDNKLISMGLGMEIDIMNTMFIYRSKKLFNLPKEMVLNHVIPYWFRLKKEDLVKMAGSHDTNKFKDYIRKTFYGKIFSSDEEQLWEINSLNLLYEFYKGLLRKKQFSLGAIIGYVHLKSMDIRNIITIIESVRYSLPEDEIKNIIIGM